MFSEPLEVMNEISVPIEIQADEPIEVQVEIPEVEPESTWCSCVKTARLYVPETPRADAKDIENNSPPTVGGLALLQYGDVAHVAAIVQIMPGGIYVKEGNKVRCQKTERFIPFNSKEIRGFWSAGV